MSSFIYSRVLSLINHNKLLLVMGKLSSLQFRIKVVWFDDPEGDCLVRMQPVSRQILVRTMNWSLGVIGSYGTP